MAARRVGRSIKLTKNDIRGRRQIGRISPRPLVDLGILSKNFLPSATNNPRAETVEQWSELESEEYSEGYSDEESEEYSEEESEEESEESYISFDEGPAEHPHLNFSYIAP